MTEDRITETLAALADLGVFKAGEEQRMLHRHGCPRGYRRGDCECPGGPELIYADHDERVPSRYLYLDTPERFHAAHR